MVCPETNENHEKKNSISIESAIIERDRSLSSSYGRLYNDREAKISSILMNVVLIIVCIKIMVTLNGVKRFMVLEQGNEPQEKT